jgi:hypothetical protein
VFILKPGQFVHINKGRLHAFRKLSPTLLPEYDCHAKMREELLHKINRKQLPLSSICISIAWDWTYRGFTAEAMNREISSMMECAALNREHRTLSLAIPETSLLHTAKAFLARAKGMAEQPAVNQLDLQKHLLEFDSSTSLLKNCNNSAMFLESEPKTVLRGILPSLTHLVARHKADVNKATVIADTANYGENHQKISISKRPDSWENPQVFSVDPYGNDFFCKLCSDELSNIYMHCDGCESILNKDFNICVRYVFKCMLLLHTFKYFHVSFAIRLLMILVIISIYSCF